MMACRLIGTKPLSEQMLEHCQLDPWEQTSVKFQSKFIYMCFIQQNLYENIVWKMAIVLSQPQCVNPTGTVRIENGIEYNELYL